MGTDDKPPEGKDDKQDQDGKDDKPQEGNLDDLPAWARESLAKANREAAGFRAKVRELEPQAKKAKELEDAGKSDSERLKEESSGHKSRADKAEAEVAKLRIALRRGLNETQAKRLVGSTEEELEADADELLASFKSSDSDDKKDTKRPSPSDRPKERLTGGGAPDDEPDESDPRKLASRIPRF